MKLGKSFIFKDFYACLVEKYGKENADKIWVEAEKILLSLEKEYPEVEKKESVFPAVSLFQAIEKEYPNEGLPFLRDYGTKLGHKVKKILEKVTALLGVPNLLWKKMDYVAGKMSSGYECGDLILTEHSLSMDVIGCPLYDGAKQLETPEAAQLFCCMDKIYMTGMRGVKYSRTKSIAEGDDVCDYRLEDSR